MQQKVAATEEEEGHDGNNKKMLCCGYLKYTGSGAILRKCPFLGGEPFEESRVCQPAKPLVVLEASFLFRPSVSSSSPFSKSGLPPRKATLNLP